MRAFKKMLVMLGIAFGLVVPSFAGVYFSLGFGGEPMYTYYPDYDDYAYAYTPYGYTYTYYNYPQYYAYDYGPGFYTYAY